MSNRINIAYLATFQKMYLSKDVFLIPYYMAREQQVSLQVIYGSNMGDVVLPASYRGVELKGNPRKHVRKLDELYDWFRYIIPYARKINTIFFCGCSMHHMFLTWLLLFLNPKISVVVFGDMEEPQARDFLEIGAVYGNGISAWIKKKFTNFFFTHVKFPVANERAYQLMSEAYKKHQWQGLVSLYPCLDDELFYSLGLKLRPWSEKENIMISVGRIGNHQKNTDMLLEALSMVNLKKWKIYLIGPVTDDFELGKTSKYEDKITNFFKTNPHLVDKVVFTGMIYDQKCLFEYYLRAKVYLSAARHEGFANVYSQAAACGCYIVSTDVGGAETASNHWTYGIKVAQEDAKDMAKAVQWIIDNEPDIDHALSPNPDDFMYSNIIAKKLLKEVD